MQVNLSASELGQLNVVIIFQRSPRLIKSDCSNRHRWWSDRRSAQGILSVVSELQQLCHLQVFLLAPKPLGLSWRR